MKIHGPTLLFESPKIELPDLCKRESDEIMFKLTAKAKEYVTLWATLGGDPTASF